MSKRKQTLNEEQLAQALNEEQLAQAMKETGRAMTLWRIPSATIIAPRKGQSMQVALPVYVECERWFDVRSFGERLLGAMAVEIHPLGSPADDYFPRWQLKWFGSAANPNVTLRIMARRLMEARDRDDDGKRVPWVSLRDL